MLITSPQQCNTHTKDNPPYTTRPWRINLLREPQPPRNPDPSPGRNFQNKRPSRVVAFLPGARGWLDQSFL